MYTQKKSNPPDPNVSDPCVCSFVYQENAGNLVELEFQIKDERKAARRALEVTRYEEREVIRELRNLEDETKEKIIEKPTKVIKKNTDDDVGMQLGAEVPEAKKPENENDKYTMVDRLKSARRRQGLEKQLLEEEMKSLTNKQSGRSFNDGTMAWQTPVYGNTTEQVDYSRVRSAIAERPWEVEKLRKAEELKNRPPRKKKAAAKKKK